MIALKRLGRDTARANIYEDATWLELQEQSISNNERHLDLGDLEKALYVKALQEKGVTVPRLCELFGVNKSAIYNYLTVANLDDSTRECLHRRLITLNHAVELGRCADVSKRLGILLKVRPGESPGGGPPVGWSAMIEAMAEAVAIATTGHTLVTGPGATCVPLFGFLCATPQLRG